MRTVGEFIAELCKKNGIEETDPRITALVGLSIQIPTDVEQSICGLMSASEAESWAKNQPAIKNHFYALAYNGIDKNMTDKLDSFEFDQETTDKIKGEKSTGKKQELLLAALEVRLKEVKKAPAGKNDDVQKDAEIKSLNDSIRQMKELHNNELKNKDAQFSDFKLNNKIDGFLSSQKWSDNYPIELRGDVGRLAVNRHLQKIGATTILGDDGQIKLMRSDNPTMEYFDSSNKNPKFDEIAALVMAENKFLAVSTQSSQNTQQHTPTVAAGNPASQNTNKSTKTVQQLLQQSMADQQNPVK